MSGDSPRRWTGRTFLALALCLLALAFSVEAKTAWYLPPHSMGSQIQAAKALPADAPQLIQHGLPDHPSIFCFLAATLLLASVIRWKPTAVSFRIAVNFDRSLFSFITFSPRNFFRPPPVR